MGYFKSPISREKNIWNKYSIQCRGLILDDEGIVIERCFPKFWTFRNHLNKHVASLSENKIVKLPNEKPKIYEKVDGTMGILYWIKDAPYIATQRSFTSLKAKKASEIIQKKYLKEAQKLDRNYSYLFEVLYKENSLVIDYKNKEDLILIGVLDKENGNQANIDMTKLGFPTKKDYTEKYGRFDYLCELEILDIPNLEGFVLEYSDIRIKVKFLRYKAISKEISKLVEAEFQKAKSIKILKEYYNILNIRNY